MSSSSIHSVDFNDALSERYLAYALSTIMSRSLPDVRDGLKPVHRRLLYAMHELKLNPGSSFKKSARVVGDVMGKFHPHGDASIYDALVRLAQDFSVRYPLIDGQGNFGNIDGDNAAAMRYTEARLTPIAALLFDGLDEKTVEFVPTYDSEGVEPSVFPASFPNLLANGSNGIAVGMATSIPPHNLFELCQALIALLENSDLSSQQLVVYIPGPDFPTGGILVENPENILKAYTTGRGSFRLRARYEQDNLKGGGYRIIITEIPYQVQKSKILEKIADLMQQKKLPLLGDIFDESSDSLRIILEPKTRNVDPEHLMESLFQQTDLDVRISLNMNVLSLQKKPEVLSLKEILTQFLIYRMDVLKNRTRFRLEQLQDRLHVLEGLLIAYLNLDEVIRIIREEDEPKDALMLHFSLSEIQAESILNMRLRSLRKLQEIELRKEHESLIKEGEDLKELLASKEKQNKYLKREFTVLSKNYGPGTLLGARRTTIASAPRLIDTAILEPVVIEPITVICSAKGWIRTQKGHVNPEDIKYKEGDEARFVLQTQSHLKILIFTKRGRAYTLLSDKFPGGRGQGDPLRMIIDVAQGDDILYIGALQHSPQAVASEEPAEPLDTEEASGDERGGVEPSKEEFVAGQVYLLINNKGRGFCIRMEHLVAQTKQGKQVYNCTGDDYVVYCALVEKPYLAMIGNHRKLLIQEIINIPFFAKGQGVTLQKYKEAVVSDIRQMYIEEGLSYRRGLQMVTERTLSPWIGKRGSAGKLAPLGFPRDNRF